MVDLYSAIYDSTDPERSAGDRRVAASPGVRRQGRGHPARQRSASCWGPARTACRRKRRARWLRARRHWSTPDAKLAKDAPELISAMLAAGYDQAAARWIRPSAAWTTSNGDRCWAMLALGAPEHCRRRHAAGSTASSAATRAADKMRSALLVAGLAGLGRISTDTANSLNRRYGLGLGRHTSWTQDDRCRRGSRPGRDGARADRHRLSDARHWTLPAGAYLSCDRRPEAHRARTSPRG